jgi:hypothetical protein
VPLGCVLIALLVPSLASAAAKEYFVNVRSIGTQDTGCEIEGSSEPCTLPGAIGLANANPGRDLIKFDPAVFQGAAPFSTITLSTGLPAIEEEVEIVARNAQGKSCNTGWGLPGPCVELALAAVASTSILTVNADDVTVEGLAFDGAGVGIKVEKGHTGFHAANDWFGVGLNTTGGSANAAAGIRLEPGADEAAIGGPNTTERNVFTAGDIGLYIAGASSSTTEGNYFGLSPDGAFPFGHTLDVGVRIVDDTRSTPVAKAVDNEIGGVLLGPEQATAACDGPCNAFAIEEEGADIDLAGFTGEHVSAASGPTRIRGNYLGLSPDGLAGIGRTEDAIYAGTAAGPAEVGPAQVTIGGNDHLAERNFILAREYGVYAESAELLGVIGNVFGRAFDGSSVEPPSAAAIRVSSESVAAGAFLAANTINAEESVGIESLFKGSQISGNEIVGAQIGIRTREEDSGVGNLVEGNALVESGGVETGAGIAVENGSNTIAKNSISRSAGVGIEVEGEDEEHQSEGNVVVGNSITEAGEIGIRVGSNADHTRVGGDTAGEANTIVSSGLASAEPEDKKTFGAISIFSRTFGRTEVAADTGTLNSGAFIKLISHGGPEKPNGGIQPPTVLAAHQSSASGTANPGAKVRVFSKAGPEAGELGALLGVVEADSGGAWKATFAKQPSGTLIAATQSGEVVPVTGVATSEVSAPLAAAPDPEEEKGGGGEQTGGGGSQSSSPSQTSTASNPPPVQPKAPQASITKGPKKTSASTTATFKFKATPAAGAKFECKLDNAKWAGCKSPKTYKKLKPGKHTFQVRATASGLTGPAAKFKFTVKR